MSEKELKATASLNLAMQIYGDEKSFRFEVVKKSGLADANTEVKRGYDDCGA